MGRPPSNGGPSFRFNNVEVAEMESILHAHSCVVPGREVLETLAEKFSGTAERSGKVEVSAKQVWNWFQNRRYAIRAKNSRPYVPGQATVAPVAQADHGATRNIPQPAPLHSLTSTSQAPRTLPASSVQTAGKNGSDNPQMEFEAKSARDGAWYDVASFLSHRALEKADPEAQVRFAGFGPEEDEWVDIRKHVRQRSLPCESSECVAVCPGDLILCFQEGKEQALYFDAHVLDAQRRRHDVRGCRCRFLVRYDHDQSEEIVPLKKICRRPESDYRLQQLQDVSVNVTSQKDGNALKLSAKSETVQKQDKHEENVNAGTIGTNVPIAKESNAPAPVEAESATNVPMETESDAGGSTSDATNAAEPITATNTLVASNSDVEAPSAPVTTNNLPEESES